MTRSIRFAGLICLIVCVTTPAGAVEVIPPLAERLGEFHLLEPFWAGTTVHRESVLFIQEPGQADAVGRLLFEPEKIISVGRADGKAVFEANADFVVSADGRGLRRMGKSGIAFLHAEDFFPKKGSPNSIPHRAGDPSTHILFDNAHLFHDLQVEVTYTRKKSEWAGYTPKLADGQLPRTFAKLRAKQPFTLAVSGDSISNGYNASAFTKASPFMPPYPDLVAAQLESAYKTPVKLVNRAISGWNVNNGLADLDKLLASKPDLVLIAYGMNDVGRRDAAGYQKGIRTMLERIKQANPETEVILVSTMLGNKEWVHTPREEFAKYRDALKELTGNGVALADMTELWTDLVKRKHEMDLNGNGVNHPNDFGHRLYAQVILAMLVEQKEGKR